MTLAIGFTCTIIHAFWMYLHKHENKHLLIIIHQSITRNTFAM